eukprot:gene12343-biopygen1192
MSPAAQNTPNIFKFQESVGMQSGAVVSRWDGRLGYRSVGCGSVLSPGPRHGRNRMRAWLHTTCPHRLSSRAAAAPLRPTGAYKAEVVL